MQSSRGTNVAKIVCKGRNLRVVRKLPSMLRLKFTTGIDGLL